MGVLGGFNAASMGVDTATMIGTIGAAGNEAMLYSYASAQANMQAQKGKAAQNASDLIKEAVQK